MTLFGGLDKRQKYNILSFDKPIIYFLKGS